MSWYALRSEVEAEFATQFSHWELVANAAWLRERHRKRAWGADAWRFDARRRAKVRDAVQRHYEQRRADEAFKAKNRAKCKAYRERRKLDPVRERRAQLKRKSYYAREWASLKADAKRYARKLAWTRAWRTRQRETGTA